MAPDRSQVSIEQLLAHHGWVEALTRTLVRGAAEAQEVEQQTWLAAVERPPQRPGNLRAWRWRAWCGIACSTCAARGGAGPSGRSNGARPIRPRRRSTSARAEARARVAQSVLSLAEPYRSTVLLHYFEGLPVAAIAQLQDVPAAHRPHALGSCHRTAAGPPGEGARPRLAAGSLGPRRGAGQRSDQVVRRGGVRHDDVDQGGCGDGRRSPPRRGRVVDRRPFRSRFRAHGPNHRPCDATTSRGLPGSRSRGRSRAPGQPSELRVQRFPRASWKGTSWRRVPSVAWCATAPAIPSRGFSALLWDESATTIVGKHATGRGRRLPLHGSAVLALLRRTAHARGHARFSRHGRRSQPRRDDGVGSGAGDLGHRRRGGHGPWARCRPRARRSGARCRPARRQARRTCAPARMAHFTSHSPGQLGQTVDPRSGTQDVPRSEGVESDFVLRRVGPLEVGTKDASHRPRARPA